MIDFETIKANLSLYQHDPTRAAREILDVVVNLSEGRINLVDPTNPVVMLGECVATTFSAFMDEQSSAVRKLFPILSQTQEELYLHMADQNYVGRFATPSTGRFGLLIAEDELLNRMVYDPATLSRKLVIPRNTFFVVSGYVFSLEYPIVISQLQHEGLRVVYDVSKTSPLQTLSTNIVEWEYAQDTSGVQYVRLMFDLKQFSIQSREESTIQGKEFSLAIPFEHAFYYARVYAATDTGWQELRTTHSEQVYDPFNVTAVLKVVDKTVQVRIPQIYTNTLLGSKRIRVDVYETHGQLDLDMSEYLSDQFGVTWMNYDKSENTEFTAPMSNFQQLIPFGLGTVTGGSGEMSLNTLRQRVMKNTVGGEIEYPISTAQIETKLQQNGYDVVLEVDNITERVFLATRAMPTPTDERLITAAASGIESVAIDMSILAQMDTVVNNGESLTITPLTLYRQNNGITSHVSKSELDAVLAMMPERRAESVSNGNWRYTPFYYVLDTSGGEFDMRAYHLDAPEAVSKTFVGENATTLLQVSTNAYGVFRTANGYTLQVVTTSSEAYRALPDNQVHVQLAYVSGGERDRAYLNGTYLGRNENNERIFQFELDTNFNVTKNDLLQLTQFRMFSNEDRLTTAELTTSFDLLYSVSSPMGVQWAPTTIDDALGRLFLPIEVAGVTHEILKIKFGDSLKTLWSRSRSYTVGEAYQRHTIDVPMLYEKDVYRTDSEGSPVSFDAQGQLVMEILHHRNDPVLDTQGLPIMKHKKGDIVTDIDGNPVPVGPRGIQRMIDIFLIDGTYWFATDISASNYRKELTSKVVRWLVEDMAVTSKKVLEKTRVYFYPKTTMGMIDVLVGDGVTKTIEAGQALVVKLQVPDLVYRDEALRKQLTTTTIRTISKVLEESLVSESLISKALSAQYGEGEVISHRVSGLGGQERLSTLRVLSDANRCSLKKRLTALPDGTLVTAENVIVEFDRLA